MTVSFGSISFSFKTDDKGVDIKRRIQDLREIHRRLRIPDAIVSTVPRVNSSKKASQPVRRGSGETSIMLEKLDQGILDSDFFVSPRSTGDVRAELKKRFGMQFAPRKVSQALGVLQKKGVLGRVGTTGNFQYFRR